MISPFGDLPYFVFHLQKYTVKRLSCPLNKSGDPNIPCDYLIIRSIGFWTRRAAQKLIIDQCHAHLFLLVLSISKSTQDRFFFFFFFFFSLVKAYQFKRFSFESGLFLK